MPSEIACFGEDFGGFLWGVKTHRVFRRDEVEAPLGLALQFEGGLQLSFGGAAFLGVGDGVELVGEGFGRALEELEVAALDGVDAGLDFFFGEVVAGLAGAVDIEERAADPVVGDFGGAVALVGHVAIGARDSGPRVDALAPEFELGVFA